MVKLFFPFLRPGEGGRHGVTARCFFIFSSHKKIVSEMYETSRNASNRILNNVPSSLFEILVWLKRARGYQFSTINPKTTGQIVSNFC